MVPSDAAPPGGVAIVPLSGAELCGDEGGVAGLELAGLELAGLVLAGLVLAGLDGDVAADLG
jgi:hypothetical protein